MSALGAGLGPFDQLQPEAAQHEHQVVPDFPFVMVTVPAWWAIVAPLGIALVEGGQVNPTAELAFAAHTPQSSLAKARRQRGWTVRPATADEIAEWQARA